MIICLCKNISQKQIDEALKSGTCRNIQELTKRLGLGSDCGGCLQEFLSAQTTFTTSQTTSAQSNHKKKSS